MKFRLTIFLLMANLAMFAAIWSLESAKVRQRTLPRDVASFTTLEISGKNIDKPRVLKFENNQWRIVSPIDWKANLFAVNRIKTQLDFIDRQTSFSKTEAVKAGHSLDEYGLESPAYVLRYGDGEKMHTIKIGKNTSVGDRFYLLDDASDSIIVVDREFVEGLVQDMERLRDQSVFGMPRFEVSAFSVRLPIAKSAADAKGDFKRVGLVREGGNWRFETPIVAAADNAEVKTFLGDICRISAVDFTRRDGERTGFELASLPTTITLQGTNKREVLMLGALSADGKKVYAKLEGNPTVFAIDAGILRKFENMQTALRDKVIMANTPSRITGIDISEGGKTLKLRRLKSGVWDVIATSPDGSVATFPANLGLVNKLMLALESVRARQFVNDAAGRDLSAYGIGADSLKISVISENKDTAALSIGSLYRRNGVNMRYAALENSPAVYGIGLELSELCNTDALFYRSPLVCSLKEGDVLESIKITNLETGKTDFQAVSENGSFAAAAKRLDKRGAAALRALEAFARNTVAESFSARKFDNSGVIFGAGKTQKWLYKIEAAYTEKGSSVSKVRVWTFSARVGAATQYCRVDGLDALFIPELNTIGALFELTQERRQPERLDMPEPAAPSQSGK